MAGLNSQITALHEIGADAMDNLYDVYITVPTVLEANRLPTEDITKQLRIRAEGFTPPKFTQKKYEVRYKTVGMNRPAARVDGAREFTLTFRLDAYYQVYHALLAWRSILFEPSIGYANQSLPEDSDDAEAGIQSRYYGSIAVYAMTRPPVYDSVDRYVAPGMTDSGFGPEGGGKISEAWAQIGSPEFPIHKAWDFQQVWISDITPPDFKNGAGDVQKISAVFQFGEYKGPETDLRSQE